MWLRAEEVVPGLGKAVSHVSAFAVVGGLFMLLLLGPCSALTLLGAGELAAPGQQSWVAAVALVSTALLLVTAGLLVGLLVVCNLIVRRSRRRDDQLLADSAAAARTVLRAIAVLATAMAVLDGLLVLGSAARFWFALLPGIFALILASTASSVRTRSLAVLNVLERKSRSGGE